MGKNLLAATTGQIFMHLCSPFPFKLQLSNFKDYQENKFCKREKNKTKLQLCFNPVYLFFLTQCRSYQVRQK